MHKILHQLLPCYLKKKHMANLAKSAFGLWEIKPGWNPLGPPGAWARFSERALRLKLRLRVFRSCFGERWKNTGAGASQQSNMDGFLQWWDSPTTMDFPTNHGFSNNMGVSKNGGYPKMDGENNGKPYFLMDDLGGKPIVFGNIHYFPRNGGENPNNHGRFFLLKNGSALGVESGGYHPF